MIRPRKQRHCGTPRHDRDVIDIGDAAPYAVERLFRESYKRERDNAAWIDLGGES